MSATGYEHRKPLSRVVARYDRVARFYSLLEPLFLIFPPARHRAVAALELEPGESVVEICVGSGRNLDLLGFTHTRFARLLDPIAKLLVQLGPGDAYSEPWKDLAAYAPVETERFLLDLYYVCRVRKPDRV